MFNDKEYWEAKVEKVVEISKAYNYPEYDKEHWCRQPAGVISLIIEIHTHLHKKIKIIDRERSAEVRV